MPHPKSRFNAPASLLAITNQSHFLYKADCLLGDDALRVARVTLSKFVMGYVREVGIAPLQIDVLRGSDVAQRGSKKVREAFCLLATALGFEKPDLVFCQSAAIHNDPTFENTTFVSHVLSTGTGKNEGPYLLNMLSDVSRGVEAESSSLAISVGDTFVFDPGAAHCAFALSPSRTSFLILMQDELVDKCEEDRVAIMERFVPQASFSTANDYL